MDLLAIISVFFVILILASLLFILRFTKKNKKSEDDFDSAAEFISVLDIIDDIIYTKTSLISILKVTPISTDLLSLSEEKRIIKEISSDFSRINETLKFLCISRPIDIAPLLESLTSDLKTTDPIRRSLLKSEISEMTEYAVSSNVAERQFFFLIEEKYKKDAKIRLRERTEKILSSSETLNLKILRDKELIKFTNLIYNPSTVNLEDTDIKDNIPMILY